MTDDLDRLTHKLDKLFESLDDDTDIPLGRQRYETLRHLWKSEDPEWLAQRKEEWRLLVEDRFCDGCQARQLKAWQAFYLTGDEPPVGAVFSPTSRVIMTPFTTPDAARSLVSLITHPEDRYSVLDGYMESACSRAQRMPWLRDRITAFVDGVLGRHYERFEMEQGGRVFVVSPEPTSFCKTYARNAIELLKGELGYSFTVDTLPYFLSALPEADKPKIRKRTKLTTMFDEAERVLDQDVQNEYAVELAGQLMQNRDQTMRSWELHEGTDRSQ